MNRVKANLKTGLKVNVAIRETINYCYENGVMVDYLSQNKKELFNMLNFEFNIDDAKEVWQEEAREDGLKQGREDGFRRGREEGMARMFETLAGLVKDGIITLADAAKRANVTVSEFEAKTGLAL